MKSEKSFQMHVAWLLRLVAPVSKSLMCSSPLAGLAIFQDVQVLAQVMDTDDDGYIDYEEFCAFLYPMHEVMRVSRGAFRQDA